MRFRPVSASATAAPSRNSRALSSKNGRIHYRAARDKLSTSRNVSHEEVLLGASILDSPDSVSAASATSDVELTAFKSKARHPKVASEVVLGGDISPRRSGRNVFSPDKRRGAGSKKRVMLLSPILRSPLGVLSPNNRSIESDNGSSITRGSGTVLFSSPQFRRTARERDLPSASSYAGNATSGPSFQIYSPEPDPPTSSKPFSKRGDFLRKERKRFKPVSISRKEHDQELTTSEVEYTNISTPALKQTDFPEVTSKPCSSEKTPQTTAKKYVFIYPTSDIPVPKADIVEYFHSLATKVESKEDCDSGPPRIVISQDDVETTVSTKEKGLTSIDSVPHQIRLDRALTKLLSLESVIVPAVALEEIALLKTLEAKAVRDGDKEAEAEIRLCRLTINELSIAASLAASSSRRKREEEDRMEKIRMHEQERLEREKKRKEREEAKQKRKEERIRQWKAEKERKLRERKKNLPRNKELYREVALLMTELAQLRKEERMWKETEVRLDELAEDIEGRDVDISKDAKRDEETKSSNVDDEENKQLDASIWNAVDGITLSANRINDTLLEVTKVMEQSEAARRELYDKYTVDHQFYGYRGVKDVKGLVLALSQEDI